MSRLLIVQSGWRRRVAASASALLLVLAATGSPSPAHAQDARAQAAGRVLFNEGITLFNKGDFEGACPKFEASLKQFPGIGTRGKLAECYERVGRVASAYLAYREVAQLATRTGDPAREQIASERAKALEPKLSYLTVLVPPSNNPAGLLVKRNGRELERAKLGSAEPVDAGSITIDATAPGHKPFSGRISVAQGVAVKFVLPTLVRDAAPPPVAPAVALTPTPAPATMPAAEETSAVRGDPPAWQKPVGLVLVGVGVVGVGAASVLGLSAKSRYDAAFDGGGCDRASKTCDGPGQRATDDARAAATLSTVLFVAGGGLAVAGAIVFLTAPSTSRRAWHVAPTTYAGGGGLTFSGVL